MTKFNSRKEYEEFLSMIRKENEKAEKEFWANFNSPEPKSEPLPKKLHDLLFDTDFSSEENKEVI